MPPGNRERTVLRIFIDLSVVITNGIQVVDRKGKRQVFPGIGQSATDSAKVRPILPLNSWASCPSAGSVKSVDSNKPKTVSKGIRFCFNFISLLLCS